MSVNRYTKITPYLVVTGTFSKINIEIKRFCADHPRIKQEKNKFCSECGKEIVSKEHKVIEDRTPMSLLYDLPDFEDQLYSPFDRDRNILLPNQYAPSQFKCDNDGEVEVNLLGRETTIEKQVNWFKTEYSKEIAYLRDKFGEKNVEVRWGVISYWS